MKPLCIYHGNCQDGFGSAWAVRHALGDGVERPVLEEMAATARSIVILDHHKSAEADLAGFKIELCGSAKFCWSDVPGMLEDYRELRMTPIIDMERSGAGMSWDCFNPNKPRPALINHIEDRDLWRFALKGTREIAAALFSHPYDFNLWNRFMFENGRLDELVIEGRERSNANTTRTSPIYRWRSDAGRLPAVHYDERRRAQDGRRLRYGRRCLLLGYARGARLLATINR